MIERAKINDIESIIALEESRLGESLGKSFFENMLSNGLNAIYILKENNVLISYISLSFDGEIVEIYNLCVNKDYEHKGYGYQILKFIIDYYKDASSFILEVRRSNDKAINLYKKVGFKEIYVRKNYYKNEDALVLELKK